MKLNKRKDCPICGNLKVFYLDKFWRCSKCLYQFADPQDKSFTKSYYQEDIGLLVQNVLEGKNPKAYLRKYATLATKTIEQLKKGLRICDIGCGTGAFLLKLEEGGHKVYGYDINRAQAEFARKKNGLRHIRDAQSLRGYCRKVKIRREFFDVITCFEVIEHVLDLNKFIEEVYAYLKPGGIFILSTPNNNRIQMHEKWDYPPIHVSRFKKMNMELLLNKHNFTLKTFKTFNELGYYSGNFIAKMNISHNALEHMVKASTDISSPQKSSRNAQLFMLFSKVKKTACWFLDLPLYLFLNMQKEKGHTMFVVAKKIV
ncbi:MAG: class I SAM-dependent methyltransferase [Candidatus Levybacteria bacterium]|nr:class I SAM-dependent methyltransferase [Candidatus Levybacteria bacterium]